MTTFFMRDRTSAAQRATLQFLTALCAGFAGAFLSGDALFKLSHDLGSGTVVAISGTAGFALFFAVWFFYPKTTPPPLEDSFKVNFPRGTTFEQAARSIAEIAEHAIHLVGFSPQQLTTPLYSLSINTRDANGALDQLRYLLNEPFAYRVSLDDGILRLTAG